MELGKGSIALSPLPFDREVKVAIPLGEHKEMEVDLKLKLHKRGDPSLRLSLALSDGERRFLQNRRPVVSTAMRKVLGLQESLREEEVPVVAVLGSGGGVRAMTGFYGSLLGLEHLGLVDCISYIAGVSGSTWCMAPLYQNASWSGEHGLEAQMSRAKCKILASKAPAFSQDKWWEYSKDMQAKAESGQLLSFTDIWGLMLQDSLFGKVIGYF
uniref:PLA2c domain-containing protein n=1 Tax=Eptatretus burgeri TaxID=7764 RepID=A0A8C4Q5J2_EPTBU